LFLRTPDIQQAHFLFNGDGSVKPSLLGPPPQIKILKRPQHNGAGAGSQQGTLSNGNGQGKPKQQLKTLQQVCKIAHSNREINLKKKFTPCVERSRIC